MNKKMIFATMLISFSFIDAMELPQNNINTRQSALGAAVRKNDLGEVEKILLEGQLDVNFSEPFGSKDAAGNLYYALTPLMWAAFYGNLPIAELLLKAGARVDLKNPYGLTASDIAIARSHPLIAQLIKERTSFKYRSLREQALQELSKIEGGTQFLEEMKEEFPPVEK